MKFRFFIVVAAIVGIAACKSPYKATDRSKTSTDTTASATDTSATMNNPSTTDTSGVSRTDTTMRQLPDSVRTDTTNRTFQDSARTDTTNRAFQDSSRMDTTNRAFQDSSRMDTTRSDTTMRSSTDTSNTNPSVDATSTQSQPPPEVEPVFTKQYPGAANPVWSHYDSLAAVPIDMRLTGWKGLDPEDHMVKFELEDETYYAWYDNKGKWIATTHNVKDISKLPAKVQSAVQNAIKTRYTGYEIAEVHRELQPANKAYEVQLTKDDNEVRMLVTPAGKITQIFKYSKQK